MTVLCVYGPLHGQTMTLPRSRWRFAHDPSTVNLRADAPREPACAEIVHYTVEELRLADSAAVALVAVLDGHTLSPESSPEFYDRAVRAGCTR